MMDEEVVLESSPLYQHLKDLEKEEFDISAIDVTTNIKHNIVYPNPITETDSNQRHDDDADGAQWQHFFLNTQLEEDRLKYLICEGLMESSGLMEEHHNVLGAYLESYHDNYKLPRQIPRSYYWWWLVHGVACAACLTQRSLPVKLTVFTSFVTHLCLPISKRLINHVLTRNLHHEQSRITGLLKVFKESDALWKSVHQFCQEVNLISLNALIVNRRSAAVVGADSATLFVRQCVYLHLIQSISSLESDIRYLHQLIDSSLIPHLGISFTTSQPLAKGLDMISLQKNRKVLIVMVSQWIFYLVILILTSKLPTQVLVTHVSKLKGFSYPKHLFKALKFRKMVLDGELEPSIRHADGQQKTDEEQTLHSLYLHSRELLRLTKMADGGGGSTREELLASISQQISDCQTCVDLVCRRKKVFTDSAWQTDAIVSSGVVEKHLPIVDYCEPVIDQVFVAAEDDCERSNDELAVDDDYVKEVQLRREYETFLMRELKGVIHELAKERINRESQLSQADGKSVEQIAKIAKQIVENRDIKGLIKCAAQLAKEDNQSTETDNQRKHRPDKYDHNTDYTCQQPIPKDLAHIASMAASHYLQPNNDDETFGSDDSDDELIS